MPYGGGPRFDEQDLVDHIRASGRNYIIIGSCKCTFTNHKKPHSLDYWLRERARARDTMQSCDVLVENLIATGLFVAQDGLSCPDSGRPCKGIVLV